MPEPFAPGARRRDHLADDNLLRAFTVVIDGVPGGINLGQGVCDLDAPPSLLAGAIDSISGGDRQTYTHYTGVDGLKEAIVDKLGRHNGITVGMDEVMVTTGSSGAFTAAVLALFDPGDEVILFEPFYPYHRSTLLLAEVVPVAVPLHTGTFDLDLERLAAAITPRTRAVLVNTPVNPSGKVFTTDELTAIADLIADTRIVVLTDEVYEYMVYDGHRHVSPATIPGLAGRTLTMNSFSKTYSITGWRIGFLAGPAPVVADCGRVFDQITVCAPRPLQRGVERALRTLPDSFYTDLRDGYRNRRDLMCDALERRGFRFTRPQGAYYVLADYRDVLGDIDSGDAVRTMIERIGVNAVPGGLFYEDHHTSREIRFHFAVDTSVVEEVGARLQRL